MSHEDQDEIQDKSPTWKRLIGCSIMICLGLLCVLVAFWVHTVPLLMYVALIPAGTLMIGGLIAFMTKILDL